MFTNSASQIQSMLYQMVLFFSSSWCNRVMTWLTLDCPFKGLGLEGTLGLSHRLVAFLSPMRGPVRLHSSGRGHSCRPLSILICSPACTAQPQEGPWQQEGCAVNKKAQHALPNTPSHTVHTTQDDHARNVSASCYLSEIGFPSSLRRFHVDWAKGLFTGLGVLTYKKIRFIWLKWLNKLPRLKCSWKGY